MFYGLLKGLIRKWIPTIQLDESIEVAEKLCSGFEENITAQMDKNLLNLAKKIAKSNKGPESKFYKKELEKFIEEYSHRSKSLDIIYPNWNENSKFVESMIKQNVNLIKNDKFKKHIDKKSQRLKVTQFCIDTISETKLLPVKLIKKYIFNTLLRITQRFMILREVQRDQWHKILSQKRRVVLEINKTLQFKNDDIFFLKYQELKSLIKEKTEKDEVLNLIRKRKKELEKNSNKIDITSLDKNIKKLKGIGVSMGVAEGKARIVNSYKELDKIEEGDILITKVIDSSWTPVFNLVSGLVTEVGGMLSHASVVARELGVPAVASASDATKIIPNGKMIKINGKDGIIQIK